MATSTTAHPAGHRTAPGPVKPGPVDAANPAVIPLNDAAELFAALAEGIRGSAVDWSPSALRKLENSLLSRYGRLLGGERAVAELVELARRPTAA